MNEIQNLANAIRFLAVDAVENAKSGHPGMPLGMADIATVLWSKFLKHNPSNPTWPNRDRFILSNGHGSMLLYALLHLTGYELTIDDLKKFRQLDSKTPGHPESHLTKGVETTTGPLGQGIANGVGMALAENILAQNFNKDNLTLIDHYTYIFAGDGCLMEGISHEACSLAGTLKLSKLILFYDDNGISIDGEVKSWFTEDVSKRFSAYDWHVIDPVDGHDEQAIEKAIIEARQNLKPSIIICKTIIGFGSKLAGSEKSHGAPLGINNIKKMRDDFNWHHNAFEIPEDIYAKWNHHEQGSDLQKKWNLVCNQYKEKFPEKFKEFSRRINRLLPEDWEQRSNNFIEACAQNQKDIATRKASQQCIEAFAPFLPELLGGSADLTGSNNTNWSGSKDIFAPDDNTNYIYYGVREFAMAAIMNGIARHGGFIPYGGTFLVFSDYARNAIRLSALMKQKVIYILTHDSIGLGEDGPTHQPIEHASMLRMTPDLDVWRPANLTETATAWKEAIEYDGASCLLLSRQNLKAFNIPDSQLKNVRLGAYIVEDCAQTPEIIVIATGSEVQLILEAKQQLKNLRIRVVSMPCAERFLKAPSQYQNDILPINVRKRLIVEAGSTPYWYRFAGLDGTVLGIDSFGYSAPANDVFQKVGLTVPDIIAALQHLENKV